MKRKILITGGTGLIGAKLTSLLLKKGYDIHHLSRSIHHNANPRIKTFVWDVYKGEIDPACIHHVDTVIHLAGEPIAGKRWTKKRKESIVHSRTRSIEMIYNLIRTNKSHTVKAVISASGANYYGESGNTMLTEDKPAGTGFLPDTCITWEKAVDVGLDIGLRVVKFRTAMVLSDEGGALPQLDKPVKLGLATSFGTGSQWTPWVHINDVLNAYVFAVENEKLSGTYNLSGPTPVSMNMLIDDIAAQLGRKRWLPNVPAFALKLALGEMSETLLMSCRLSADKLQSEGFEFQHLTPQSALEDIYAET